MIRLRAVPALLLFALAACGPTRGAEGPRVAVTAQLIEGGARNGALVFRSGLELASPDARFGGFSSLLVSQDGGRLLSISDKGRFLEAHLGYDEAGRLVRIGDATMGALSAPDGRPIPGTRWHDSESVTRAGNDLIVGFEGPARLWRYPGGVLAAPPRVLAPPAAAARLPGNKSFEAICVLADGRMLILAEAPPKPGRPVAWTGTPGHWRVRRYARVGLFVPDDVAPLADGGAVVLERRFTFVGGAASRIVYLPAAQIRGNGRLEGEELARIEDPAIAENYEGLALRKDPKSGEMLLYLISDDNFSPLQSTRLLLYAWKRGLQ